MIVVDTHVLLWWVNGSDTVSTEARVALERECDSEQGLILVSSISVWEIAMLMSKDRLRLGMDLEDWLETVREIDAVRFVPVDNTLAMQSTRLPGDFHPDPADRMIVALARHYTVPLLTADRRIRDYLHVRTIW